MQVLNDFFLLLAFILLEGMLLVMVKILLNALKFGIEGKIPKSRSGASLRETCYFSVNTEGRFHKIGPEFRAVFMFIGILGSTITAGQVFYFALSFTSKF